MTNNSLANGTTRRNFFIIGQRGPTILKLPDKAKMFYCEPKIRSKMAEKADIFYCGPTIRSKLVQLFCATKDISRQVCFEFEKKGGGGKE